jgi:hypothetical protein
MTMPDMKGIGNWSRSGIVWGGLIRLTTPLGVFSAGCLTPGCLSLMCIFSAPSLP